MSQQKTEPKNFEWVAKRILKSQKKLGTLKGLKVNVLSLSDSRKKYLKQAGLFAVTTVPAAALATIAGYKLGKINPKKALNNRTTATAAGTALGFAGVASVDLAKKQDVVIEAKYKYGTKLFEVANLTKEQLDKNIDKKILREVTAAVASLKTAKEWTVKESASVDYLNLAVLGETLIEDVLESQLLEDADVTAAATDAARNVSDFEDVEDDEEEEVEEDFLFEDEDCEDSDEDEVEEACDDSEDSDDDDDEEVEEGFLFEDDDEEAEATDDEAKKDSDEEEVEEAVEEGFLFEDDDEEAEATDDEEELDEEVIFETDMFKI